MKRELKFRGISTDMGKMIEGYGVCAHDGNAVVIHKQGINLMQHTEVVPETVGEYVYETDLKEKDIYSGDILSVRPKGANHPIKYVVVFSEFYHSYRLRFVDRLSEQGNTAGYYDEVIDKNKHDIFEVIGNIYENPELLSK